MAGSSDAAPVAKRGSSSPRPVSSAQGEGPDVVETSTIRAIYNFGVILGLATLGVLIYPGAGSLSPASLALLTLSPKDVALARGGGRARAGDVGLGTALGAPCTINQ
jgi:hypothetical protein